MPHCIIHCGWQLPKWPHDSYLLVVTLYVVPSPWVRAGPSDLPSGRSDGILLPRLSFEGCYFNFPFSLAFLACSLKWGCMPCCEVAYVGTYKTKNKGRPLAKSQWEAETLSSAAGQELKPEPLEWTQKWILLHLSLEFTVAFSQHLDCSLWENQRNCEI